jgi:tetratricopeptide (TPR) repeat protein
MASVASNLKHTVTAACLFCALLAAPSLWAANTTPDLAALLGQLRQAGPTDSATVARDIRMRWAQSGSDTIDLLLKRGKDALERGETDAAIEHLTAALDHAPDFAETYHARAQAYATAGLVGPALADLEQALHLNPAHFDALYGLAVLLEEVGRPKLAYETYVLVLKIYPHYEEAQAARARLHDRVMGRKL